MTTLNVNLSANLQTQTELKQKGVWAYAVYFDSRGNNPTGTPLVLDGEVQQGGTVPIVLPDVLSSGKIYFIVQSPDTSKPYDLQTLITMQSECVRLSIRQLRSDSRKFTLR